MTLAAVALPLPNGYFVAPVFLPDGKRYRAVTPLGQPLAHRRTPHRAQLDAWDHYNEMWCVLTPEGERQKCPRARLRVTRYGVTDVLTGHSVPHMDVRLAGSYAGAFRLRAERMRHAADGSRYERLAESMQHIADMFEEIAQRLELGETDAVDNPLRQR